MTFLDISEARPQHNMLPSAVVVEPRQNEVPLLVQYWRIALRWKWVMATIVALALVAGLVLTLLVTPEYTATARIEISRTEENITKVEGLTRDDPGTDQEFYQTQYALLKARSLAERVARSLNLGDNNEFFALYGVDPDGGSMFEDNANRRLTAQQRENRIQVATDILLEHVAVAPVRGSSLVDVSFTSPDPATSARIANAWTTQFMESNLARRFASTADARRFLEDRLKQLRARLEQSERDLVGYASNKQIITLNSTQGPDGRTTAERTLVEENLERLNAALAQATADRVAAEARAQAGRGTTSAALSNTAINALREQRAQTAAEYAKMLVQFEPGYPAAKALASQISSLDQAIAREEERVQSGSSGDYRQALQREQDLQARVNALKQGFVDQRRDSIQYNIYQREVDTNRELYDGLLQRYKEIGVAGVGSNTVAIVDQAEVPESPSSPNLLLNMLLAFIAGVILAIIAALVLDQIDEGIKDPSEVSKTLGVPLLGSVPTVEEDQLENDLNDQKSSVFEAYLSIQTNLAFSTSHGVPKSLMVTSTRAAEGKSTTSIALARILGRIGRKVALIDGDMRSPSLHARLGIANENGLSNFLAGADDLQAMLAPTPHKGVLALTTGPQPPNAAELLSGTRMKLLVERLLQDFDHVLIDAPPVLGLADAPLLAAIVEGTVYVVEANGVRARGIRAAIDRLRAGSGRVSGVVLTKLDERNAFHGYGYGYGYGYGKSDKA